MSNAKPNPPLHEALRPLAFLLGTWRGEGRGIYPTIEDFDYGEEVRFWHAGKPVLSYAQRTWSLGDSSPLHSEMGFWRPQPSGGLELVIAHPFGIAEVTRGSVRGTRIEASALSLTRSPSADPVEGLTRTLEVSGDVLSYEVDMAASGQRLQRHLTAKLERERD